jgi:tetratricopeptide (TPR) repeat protein
VNADLPDASFLDCVLANLNYWRQTVTATPESDFGVLDADWPNLVRAVSYGLALPETRPAVAELALAAFDFVERRGYWEAWLPLLRALLDGWPEALRASPAAPAPPRTHALLLDQYGNFLRLGQRPAEAVAAHTEAEALWRELDDRQQLARVHHALSEDYRVWRRYAEAEHFGVLALEEFEQLELAKVAGNGGAVLNTLGLTAYARGDFEIAEQMLTRAVALWRNANTPVVLARILTNLAFNLEAQGKVEAALSAYFEAGEILEATVDELKRSMLQLSLGTLYFNQGRLAEAEAAFAQADSPYLRASGHLYYQAVTANNQGNLLLAQKRLDEAESKLRLAISLWRQMEDGVMLANTLGTLGEALGALDRPTKAINAYDEALELLARYPEDAWAKRLLGKFREQREALLKAG